MLAEVIVGGKASETDSEAIRNEPDRREDDRRRPASRTGATRVSDSGPEVGFRRSQDGGRIFRPRDGGWGQSTNETQ